MKRVSLHKNAGKRVQVKLRSNWLDEATSEDITVTDRVSFCKRPSGRNRWVSYKISNIRPQAIINGGPIRGPDTCSLFILADTHEYLY